MNFKTEGKYGWQSMAQTKVAIVRLSHHHHIKCETGQSSLVYGGSIMKLIKYLNLSNISYFSHFPANDSFGIISPEQVKKLPIQSFLRIFIEPALTSSIKVKMISNLV